jgi:hypothetical protein
VLPGPLHRLTRLADDPAAGWLQPIDQAIVLVKGWAAWALYAAAIRGAFLVFRWVIATASGSYNLAQPVAWGLSLPGMITIGLGAVCIIPMRRTVVRVRANAIAKMARQAAEDAALAVDDLSMLRDEPDGQLVSLVGWVRGEGYLDGLVDGQRAVGLTLRCQDGLPFLLESVHNFELVDEAGNEALVATGEGRVYAESNVRLSRASADDRQLLISLDLPPSAVPTDWNAFVVRDGDPVMVIGTKTTIQDYTQIQLNRSVARSAVASSKRRPLLIFPLDAERREV